MSTALLKFQPVPTPKEVLESSVLLAGLDASPEPMALIEGGKLIYGNRSFTQLSTQIRDRKPQAGSGASDPRWCTTDFAVGPRALSVTTLSRKAADSTPEATHLEMLGRLVGGVAHDFNNLLTGILLYCDLVKTKLPAANPLARKIEEIRHAADQGAGLIRQLMTVGREEKDAPQWSSFNHTIRDLLPLLRHLVGEQIEITVSLAAGSPRVGISLAEAQQLALNLVLNARDAMPGGGAIYLETRVHESEGACETSVVEFIVADSGAGMDPETAKRIFEPFYTTKPGVGTGTGLATVKRIVAAAGGTVCVQTTPGSGTRMAVRLPQTDLARTDIPRTEGDSHPAPPLRQRPGRTEIHTSKIHPSRKRGTCA